MAAIVEDLNDQLTVICGLAHTWVGTRLMTRSRPSTLRRDRVGRQEGRADARQLLVLDPLGHRPEHVALAPGRSGLKEHEGAMGAGASPSEEVSVKTRVGLVVTSVIGRMGLGPAAHPKPSRLRARRSRPRSNMSHACPARRRSSRASSTPSGGREVLVTTGRFGFKTYDVSDPTSPQLLDSFQPPEILGPNGYWQDEDMDIDVRRNLIIGALDPRHDNVDQASCPGIGTLRHEDAQPRLPLGLLRHLVRRSGEPHADRRLRRAARGPHDELHRRLQLRLDGRAGAPQRPGRPRAVHAGRTRRRPADLGDEPQGPGASGDVPGADRPRPQRRAHRLLARRRRRRPGHRVGRADAAACAATRPAASGAIPRTTSTRRQAVGSDPRRGRRHRRRPERRRAAADGLHPQLGAAARRQGPVPPASRTGTSCS